MGKIAELARRKPLHVGAILMSLGVVASSPLWIERVGFFTVRQVEVHGTRFLDVDRLLDAAAIAPDRNLFESSTSVVEGLLAVPGVAEAAVQRRLPATLLIAVTERLPVALVSGPDGMIALDSDAHPLPYDVVRLELDLPIVASAAREFVDAVVAVRLNDPELFAELSFVSLSDGLTVLDFGDQRALADYPLTGEIVLQLGAVRRYLRETGRVFELLDARFAGRVITRGRGA